MTLKEAKEILLQAQETMRFGSHNDMMCHSHSLVKALEFVLRKYDEIINAELEEVALMQHQHRLETNKEGEPK